MIVATSVPGVIGIYRGVYGVLIRVAVWRLKRTASIRAIYLRRGLAAGDGLPGISDIDLAAVGDWDADTQAHVTESYRRLARWCPLYDPTIGVYSPAGLAELFQADPFHRHRLAEGQREWKLLFGVDSLSHLGPVPEEDASFGYEAELKVWWSYLARWVYLPARIDDAIFLNSLCYKVVAECFRMRCGLTNRPIPATRVFAMDAALAEASNERAVFLEKLRKSAADRHLRYSGDIVEDTQAYVLDLLEQTYAALHQHPGWSAIPGTTCHIDAPDAERLHPETLPQAAGFRVSLASGAAFAMDELVLLFEPVSGRIPPASDLQHLVREYSPALTAQRSRVSFYLRLPNASYQFYASDYFRGWQTILSPRFNPDVFLNTGAPPAWTRPAAEFVRMERQLIAETLDNPVIYKANHLDFLRTFWKFLELALIQFGVRRGEIVFAQTPEAVTRGLLHLNLAQVPFLPDFAAAYRGELRGEPSQIGRHVPAAIQFLKTIHNEL